MLQIPNLSLKLVQLKWPLRRLTVIIIRELLEQNCSSKNNITIRSAGAIIPSEAECPETRALEARCSKVGGSEPIPTSKTHLEDTIS